MFARTVYYGLISEESNTRIRSDASSTMYGSNLFENEQ